MCSRGQVWNRVAFGGSGGVRSSMPHSGHSQSWWATSSGTDIASTLDGEVEDRGDSSTAGGRPHDRERPRDDGLRTAEVVVTHPLLADGAAGDGVVVDEA